MNIRKSKAFTLSETLITLTVVGVLAALVIPGLIKDSTNRAMIALLQSTVSNIDANIQTELSKTHSSDMQYSKVFKNPQSFLNDLDAAKTVEDNSLFASGYRTMDSAEAVETPTMTASAILKNGAVIGVTNTEEDEESETAASVRFYVDANGPKEPNIWGVDMFELAMIMRSDLSKGEHVGDLGCGSVTEDVTLASCKSGGTTCYCLLERSGFDSNYLNIKPRTEEDEEEETEGD